MNAKKASFIFESRIELKHHLYKISSMKSKAKMIHHNQTAQTLSSRVYLSIMR